MSGFVLALDTAGPRCAVALVDEEGCLLAGRDPEIGRGHAERLMDLVAEVLAERRASHADIARIAVSVGPGSFTGLRVGVAAARGLALALGVPALGVSTLEALGEPFREVGPVLAAIDAKRGEVYLAVYGPADATPLPPMAVRIDDLSARLEADPPRILVGSGAAIVAAQLGREGSRVENAEGRVDLASLARVALRRPSGLPPRPLYLRGADAKPQSPSILAFRPGNTPGGALP